MNSVVFYTVILFALLLIFIPSIYNYFYSSFIGRIAILILLIYFSKVNFCLGLMFITIIIIKSAPLYEGMVMPQMVKRG